MAEDSTQEGIEQQRYQEAQPSTVCSVSAGVPETGGGGDDGHALGAADEDEEVFAPEHAQKLVDCGIDPRYAFRRTGLRTVSEDTANMLMGREGRSRHAYGPSIRIDFICPFAGAVVGTRIRPSNPRVAKDRDGKERVIKYDQKADTDPLVYFPPTVAVELYSDTSIPLVFCEGEFKAIVLAMLGYPVIGLTGVDNFVNSKKERKGKLPKLHPVIAEHVAITGRMVTIIYDADSRDPSKQIGEAARRLAATLIESGAKEVRFAAPPKVKGDPKTGIDDFYANEMLEGRDGAAAVAKVISKAFRFDLATEPKVRTGSNVLQLHGDDKTLSVDHARKLQFGDITAETFLDEGWYSEGKDANLGLLLGLEGKASKLGGGWVIPFRRPGEEQPFAYKVFPNRPREVGRGNGRRTKYVETTKGFDNLIYWPRCMGAEIYRNAVRFPDVIVTSSEAAAVVVSVALGKPAIALSHQTAWLNEPSQGSEEGGERLHPDLARFINLKDRRFIVVNDSSAAGIDSRERSVRRFAGFLKEAGVASVRYCTVPTEGGRRRNVEDLYAQAELDGNGCEALQSMIADAAEVESISPKAIGIRIREIVQLSGAPIDKSRIMPPGYNLDKLGRLTYRPNQDDGPTVIARGAIWPERYLRDITDGSYSAEVHFVGNGNKWKQALVDRVAIVDASAMTKTFGKLGGPVAGHSAAGLVRWVDDFLVYNHDLPESKLVRRGGWHTIEGNEYSHFITSEAIVEDGVNKDIIFDDRDSEGLSTGVFKPLDPRGSKENHLKLLKECTDSCLVVTAGVCGSFSAPLLKPLGLDNFAMQFSGESSKGKTAALMVAASPWGNPSARGAGVIVQHNTTSAGAEQRAIMFSDMPLLYDEVKKENDGEAFVYNMVNSGAKGRGTPHGRPRKQDEWFTVLLLTGEHDLIQDKSNTGARARVIKLTPTWSEIERISGKSAKDRVHEIQRELLQNYGELGRDWVRRLMSVDWSALSERHRYYHDQVFGRDVNTGTGKRFAGYFATLAITEELLHEYYGLGMPDAGYTQILWDGFDKDVDHAHERAANVLLDSINSEPASWPTVESLAAQDGNAIVPRNVIYGYIKSSGHKRDRRHVLVIPSGMRAVMDKYNIPWDTVSERWLAEGALEGEPGGRNGKMRPIKLVRIPRTGIRSRFYVCDLSRVEELAGITNGAPEVTL